MDDRVLEHIRECDRQYEHNCLCRNSKPENNLCRELLNLGFDLMSDDMPLVCIQFCSRWGLNLG